MSTAVFVHTNTHSVTFVTDKILTSIKDIVRLSGLDPTKLANDWTVLELGINTWLGTQHLEEVILEVFNPKTNELVGRWDFEIYYNYTGDGSFWLDPDVVKYHIKKLGLLPSACSYRIVATTKYGRPDVAGWSSTTLRSTEGFVKQSIGTGINGSGLNTGIGYWRKN
jgi:Bacterial HORMA domain 2